jgi:hypothetical protein
MKNFSNNLSEKLKSMLNSKILNFSLNNTKINKEDDDLLSY